MNKIIITAICIVSAPLVIVAIGIPAIAWYAWITEGPDAAAQVVAYFVEVRP